MTGGWQNNDLITIAARPAVGKTAFALHLAKAAAAAGHHTVVYSLEMQGERLGDRWAPVGRRGGPAPLAKR